MSALLKKWLPDMDLNHDKQIQSLLCYRYTIGQIGVLKVNSTGLESRTLSTPNPYVLRFACYAFPHA